MNEIFIYDVIGEDWFGGVSATHIADALKEYKGQDVTVRINSPGGSVYDGVAIYNLLQTHDGAVNVRVDGVAASAASVIAMAGDEIEMLEGSFIMIHNPMWVAMGDSREMRKAADTLDKYGNEIARLYAKATGNSMEAILDWMDEETWFPPEDALENGFATTVDLQDHTVMQQAIERPNVAAFGYKHAPPSLVQKQGKQTEKWRLNLARKKMELTKT